MFRAIYYISGIILALLNSRRMQSYDRWLQDTRMVRRDTLVTLSLLFVIGMLSLFTWYWLPITVIAIVFLNMIVYFGFKVWRWFIKGLIVKK